MPRFFRIKNISEPNWQIATHLRSAVKPILVWLLILTMPLLTGCQSSRVRWNLFNWQNLERVPPPSTGTLSIPGINTTQLPTSALPTPPSTLPNGYNLPQPGGINPGGINPGVYFNNPATNQFPPTTGLPNQWQNASGNNVSANGTLSAIPGRDSTASWTPNQIQSGFAPNTNIASVPPLLNSANFDPFSTDRIPSWNPNILAQSPPTGNPLMVTTPTSNGNSNSQLGWWPNSSAYSSQATYANPNTASGSQGTFGDGHILRNMQQSVKNAFNQQPANLGGFQTTAAIDNPMILATGYQANGYPARPVQQSGSPAVQPVDPQIAAQQWAQYQQQQLDLLRAQQMQQLQAQAAVNPALGIGTGQMQVLAENTTSEIAESQSRMGIRTASSLNMDPRYSGQVPQGSAAVAPGSVLR